MVPINPIVINTYILAGLIGQKLGGFDGALTALLVVAILVQIVTALHTLALYGQRKKEVEALKAAMERQADELDRIVQEGPSYGQPSVTG